MSFPVSLDLALNLFWVAICVSCLIVAGFREYLRPATSIIAGRLRRGVALVVLLIAIFPCVSVSDDEISLWFLTPNTSHRGGMGVPVEEKEKVSHDLARLLDAIEHCQIGSVWSLCITLCFFAVIELRARQSTTRILLHFAGRAPPVA